MWQRAHSFFLKCYDFYTVLPAYEQPLLFRQLIRSAGSVPACIAEGFGRFHYKEFVQFLRTARGSLEETRYWLIVARDRGYISSDRWYEDNNELVSIRMMLNGLITSQKEKLKGK